MDGDKEKNVVGKYQLGKVLGAGDFDCTIRVCTHTVTGQTFAVRVYSKAVLSERGAWQQLADAVQVVRTLPRSDRIVETVECFETASFLYILMAFAPGVSLYKLLVLGDKQPDWISLDLNDKRIIFQQFLGGLQHLHSHDVAHMGLAPDHVLIHWDRSSTTKFQTRIGFLVACKKVEMGEKMMHLCGTNHTVSPEVLRQMEPYDPFLADIWSAGVIFYFMLSGGKYPFDGANTSKHILAHDVRPLDPSLPSEARELVHAMMSPDPAKRPSLQQVIDHPWLANQQRIQKNMQSVVANAITARRDDQSGKVIIRVMPLMFPRKEQAARIIQAVWRLVRVRTLRAPQAVNRSASMRNKQQQHQQGGGGGMIKVDTAADWGATVESGSDMDDETYESGGAGAGASGAKRKKSNRKHLVEEEDAGFESEIDDDLDDEDASSPMRRSRLLLSKRMLSENRSTVPPMPATLIAHDVRCQHCGRVPATTFQPGKHPFPKSQFTYVSPSINMGGGSSPGSPRGGGGGGRAAGIGGSPGGRFVIAAAQQAGSSGSGGSASGGLASLPASQVGSLRSGSTASGGRFSNTPQSASMRRNNMGSFTGAVNDYMLVQTPSASMRPPLVPVAVTPIHVGAATAATTATTTSTSSFAGVGSAGAVGSSNRHTTSPPVGVSVTSASQRPLVPPPLPTILRTPSEHQLQPSRRGSTGGSAILPATAAPHPPQQGRPTLTINTAAPDDDGEGTTPPPSHHHQHRKTLPMISTDDTKLSEIKHIESFTIEGEGEIASHIASKRGGGGGGGGGSRRGSRQMRPDSRIKKAESFLVTPPQRGL